MLLCSRMQWSATASYVHTYFVRSACPMSYTNEVIAQPPKNSKQSLFAPHPISGLESNTVSAQRFFTVDVSYCRSMERVLWGYVQQVYLASTDSRLWTPSEAQAWGTGESSILDSLSDSTYANSHAHRTVARDTTKRQRVRDQELYVMCGFIYLHSMTLANSHVVMNATITLQYKWVCAKAGKSTWSIQRWTWPWNE